jgi:hypothetical protein
MLFPFRCDRCTSLSWFIYLQCHPPAILLTRGQHNKGWFSQHATSSHPRQTLLASKKVQLTAHETVRPRWKRIIGSYGSRAPNPYASTVLPRRQRVNSFALKQTWDAPSKRQSSPSLPFHFLWWYLFLFLERKFFSWSESIIFMEKNLYSPRP